MRSSRSEWAGALTLRATAAIAAAVLLSAVLFAARPLGFASAVTNSPVSDPLLFVPFLIAYALGYEVGTAVGLTGVALLITALQVVNGAFDPVEIMITAGPWIAGRIVRSRRRLADQLRARNDELRAQQEAYAAEAVRYERSRIAADLHDLVGHALSLVVIQASAGQRAALTQGASAGSSNAGPSEVATRMALETVAEAARKAQAEVGLLTGLLSGEQAADGDAADGDAADGDAADGDAADGDAADGDAADSQPGSRPAGPPAGSAQVGLDLAAELVRRAQSAGLDVTYRHAGDGDDRDLGTSAAEVVSRIVTEALTNALKHAPGAPVTVDVRTAAAEVTVTVENGASSQTGSDLSRAGGGYGLKGMRDRVLAHGGRFDAGPTAESGWRVHAVLPASHPKPALR